MADIHMTRPFSRTCLLLVTVALNCLANSLQASDLTEAVENNSAFQVERCLRNGANPDEEYDGAPVLVHAARNENFEICRSLLLHGANPDINASIGDDAFLTLKPTENRDQLSIQLLFRTYRFLKHNSRPKRLDLPKHPGRVVLAEPTVDYTHPAITKHYYVDAKELKGVSNVDDDSDGFVDDVYGWGMVADRPHEINRWQLELYTKDASLISELMAISNRLERGEISRYDPEYAKLSTSFRNPVAALFGATNYGFSDSKFLDQILFLSHGTHVAGIVLNNSDNKAQIHTLSWENFGPYSREVLGYPPVSSGDPAQWLEEVRKHRFPRLIEIGQRASDYLRSVDASVVNASFGVSLESEVALAADKLSLLQLYNPDLPADTVTLLANEMFAYETLPYLIPVAENPQILFVAAAGNDRHNVDDSFDAPAFLARLFPNVLSVVACDNDGTLASFSNFGRKSANVGAPGVNIESLGIAGTTAVMSGTSMAAPAVAGIAAKHRIDHPHYDAGALARLIELSATMPAGQGPLSVSSGGLIDKNQMNLLDQRTTQGLTELAWRIAKTPAQLRPEIWHDAVDRMTTVADRNRDDADLQWAQAVLFDQVSMHKEALSSIERSLFIDASKPEKWLSKALILFNLGESQPVQDFVDLFETNFKDDETYSAKAVRRDIMAIASEAALTSLNNDRYDHWKATYNSMQDQVGRADGSGTPTAFEDGWKIDGNLQTIVRPTPEGKIFHRYAVKCDSSKKCQIDLTTETFDGYLIAMSPGDVTTENDDFESSLRHSQIVLDTPEDGEYVILVTSARRRDTGNYSLKVTGGELSLYDTYTLVPQVHRR